MNIRYNIFAGLLVVACLSSADVFAASDAVLGIDSLVGEFESKANDWLGPILRIATTVFWSLAIMEFILCFGKLAIQGTDFAEVTIELFRRILILSFGWWLISNPWVFWHVISGFLDSAALAMGKSADYRFNAEQVMIEGRVLVEQIFNQTKELGWFQISESLMLVLTALIILWGLGVAAGQMLMVMCEMYIVISQGLIMLGLYSLEMTREYPMKLFGSLIGTGMKLFSLQLIIGLGFSLILSWVELGATDVGSYMVMAGAAIAFKEIAVKVPDYMSSLFSGSPGSGISAGGAVAAAGTVGGRMGAFNRARGMEDAADKLGK